MLIQKMQSHHLEIVKLHRIQHSLCAVLVFLLQFSSLQFSSLGYTVPDKHFINCGSDSNVTVGDKVYVGESKSNTVARFSRRSKTESNESQVPSPLYQTARIFRRESSYEFNIDTNGTYLVRLHFFCFSSRSNLYSARFNVSVPGFWLVQNFDARNDTDNNFAPVKEFFMEISPPSFKITFRPLSSSFAFVNAIELFLLPLHLISDEVSSFAYSGNPPSLHSYKDLYSRVLATRLRLNVGGQIVTYPDNLLRKWIPDDHYLANAENANLSSYQGQIEYRADDDSDGPNANQFTAPSDVYGTAREINNSSASAGNITWTLPVEKNIDHLLRFHFCDYWNLQTNLTIFFLFIYDTFVMPINDDEEVSNLSHAPYYYDVVVHSDNSGFIKVSVAPSASAPIPNAFLNGLEIMKLIDSSDSVPPVLDEPESKHNRLPVVLGSVLGGLVLVFFVVILGFLWRLKIKKKEKHAENSDWLPMLVTTAGGSSQSRLTDQGTSQGSALPNINLGLKIPLLDRQLATNNFHASQIIGQGSFGNVYKGVLQINNGITVAVKRGEPGSAEGLPEFQTEIMVLSQIRHRNLVSLMGYCDENFEMILVYEYMEKGTLREHLSNKNLSRLLSWKKRLEICIGAASGLCYLHKGAAGGIIHRDVKTTNILLDENHVAKVADFGLSRTGPIDHQQYVTTVVKGTLGYLDPEYFKTQQLTEKSDVYSFGVVLLEVLCARAVIDPSLPREEINLAEWGMLCKNKGMLQDIVDPSIMDQIDQNSLRKFSETVEKCLQDDGSDRPTMDDVLWDLEYALHLQRGVNAIQRVQHEDSSSSVSASLQFLNVRPLPSLSTLGEAEDLSNVKSNESDNAADSVFSMLKIDDAR